MGIPLRIGVIGGAGWLAGAIAESMLKADVVEPDGLTLSYRSRRPEILPGAAWTPDNQELADRSDVVLMSVRPSDWRSVEVDAGGKLLISVMAGVTLAELQERHNTGRVVRALPNAAAEVGKSYTPWTASTRITEDDRSVVRTIFESCGIQDEVPGERDIDYLTGLTGSGPAFPALLAAAMLKDALGRGLPPAIAHRAVRAVIAGAAGLLEQKDQAPAEIVEAFLDYRGTTAAGIEAMRKAGFDRAVSAGLAAAFETAMHIGGSASRD